MAGVSSIALLLGMRTADDEALRKTENVVELRMNN
jgi:hypothetical protein